MQCELCGISDKRLLEKHHYYGRNVSPKTMRLCKNCHFLVSKYQNEVEVDQRKKGASNNELAAFAIISIGALYSVMGDILMGIGGEILNETKN